MKIQELQSAQAAQDTETAHNTETANNTETAQKAKTAQKTETTQKTRPVQETETAQKTEPAQGPEETAVRARAASLAERIYNLDSRVYSHVGSSLGRTLISPRAQSIEILTETLLVNPRGVFMLKTLALISGMARTVRDKSTRTRLLSEYNAIVKELDALTPEIGSSDIGDRSRMSLNPFATPGRRPFSSDDHLVICISRSYGSGGNDIGFQIADQLHINYYDATVLQDVLDRQAAEQEAKADGKSMTSHLESDQKLHGIRKWLRDFNRFHGLPQEDALFFRQSEYIEERARSEDLVIMGRCADVILRNARIPHVSIFITASQEKRNRRIMQLHQCSYKDAAREVRREDRAHERFYNRYTGSRWGSAITYDLCVNSASYGIEESVELILRVIRARVRSEVKPQ